LLPPRRIERHSTGIGAVRIVDRKCRQHAIAKKFQDLRATLAQRLSHYLEYLVEEVNEELSRRIGNRGEAANVGIPEHCPNSFHRPALDGAGMDAAASVTAEIGLQQSRCNDIASVGLQGERESPGSDACKSLRSSSPNPPGRSVEKE